VASTWTEDGIILSPIERALGPNSAALTPQQLVVFGENFASRETRWSRLGNDSWMAVSLAYDAARALAFGAGDSGEIVAREEPHP
jgi:hypothetical protein